MTTVVEVVLGVHEALDAAALPHAFGGALALAYAVEEPRGTVDVDVNIFVDAADAERAMGALPEQVAWGPADLARAQSDGQVRVWWEDVPLDLFFDYHEIHEHAAAGAVTVPFDDTTLRVLAPDHLAVFKAFFDRTKDWADIEAMAECRSFDPSAVRRWLERLLGADDPRLAKLSDALTSAELRRLSGDGDDPPRLPGA